ncbi:MAG: hypothetical protein QNJ27_01250 [Simkaniaceae bacterium]|nr:hypothetical protein [Simkaniaceae bacterium]
MKAEEDFSEQLEGLVKSGKVLKYSGYLSDFSTEKKTSLFKAIFKTVVDKYIPVELFEKDYDELHRRWS